MHKTIKMSCFALLLPGMLYAQNVKKLTIQEAIQLGIENSKNLKLSQNKIDESLAKMAVVKDQALPSATASILYNHLEFAGNHTLGFGSDNLGLPRRLDAYLGTVSLSETIYGGGKQRLARQNTKLLSDVAHLDAEKVKEEAIYATIDTYYALYKLSQSHKVVEQNLTSIASQLKQATRFFEQGIVTKNDVLRFQLQQANVNLTKIDLEGNSKIINYNLDILLGLPEDTQVEISDPASENLPVAPLSNYLDLGMATRQELGELDLQNKMAEIDIKNVKANSRPTFGVGASGYYVSTATNPFPGGNQYLAPVSLSANLSWNMATLWTNKHKISDARIMQKQVDIQKTVQSDNIRTEINKNYQNYVVAKNKITILETSIEQASENDRLFESKYKNNVASATDRIDAETLLLQAQIDLEIAKADAGLAYYTLLKSTGKISQ